MGRVSQTEEISSPAAAAASWSPALVGGLYCLTAAVLYTLSNACLRKLTGGPSSVQWVLCVRESVMVFLIGPWVLLKWLRGQRLFSSRRAFWLLLAVGLATELGGNVLIYLAFGLIGMAAAVPINLACILIGSAVLGWTCLGERVSWRSALAIGLLVAAVAWLAWGAQPVHASGTEGGVRAGAVVLGVIAACLAGTVFSTLSAAIRAVVTRGTSPAVIMVIITTSGVLTLGPLSVYTDGLPQLLHTSPGQWVLMLASGLFNMLAFGAVILGLQATTVVHANAINSTQTAMAAIAGLLLGEPITASLALGVSLTVAGTLLVEGPAAEVEPLP